MKDKRDKPSMFVFNKIISNWNNKNLEKVHIPSKQNYL